MRHTEDRVREIKKLKINKEQLEDNKYLKSKNLPIRYNKYGQWMHHTSIMRDEDGDIFTLMKANLYTQYWKKQSSRPKNINHQNTRENIINDEKNGIFKGKLSDEYLYNCIVLIG